MVEYTHHGSGEKVIPAKAGIQRKPLDPRFRGDDKQDALLFHHSHYSKLAELFDFPGPSFVAHGGELLGILRESYPTATVELQCFLDGVPAKTIDLQELYTRTFDVQAITTLDIGYLLFGDDYKRAELLSHLSREHKQVANDCGSELADHLPNLLRLIPKLKDQELSAELAGEILIPALRLMIREFDSERIGKKNVNYRKHYKTLIESAPGNDPAIYCRALKVLLEVLTKDFHMADDPWKPLTGGFLGQIEKEMEIEKNANPTNSGGDS